MKRGSVLSIIGIVFLVLIFLIFLAGIYFYNFYVFETVRICLGDAEDTFIFCDNDKTCQDFIFEKIGEENINDAPNFIKEKFNEILSSAVYCEESCKFREIRGINMETQELENLESCNAGEKEFVIEVHGKEGLEILNFVKKFKSV